jgi:uncharacterized membrane protein YkvA (DUF1232 family)
VTHQSPIRDFPREEFVSVLRRLPAYGRLALVLARDPRLSRVRRAALIAAAAYVFSPIDLVPGFVPVLGQLDDLAIALAAIRLALDGLNPQVRAERLAAAGLTQAELEADIRSIGRVTGWLMLATYRVGLELASGAIKTTRIVRGALVGGRRRIVAVRQRSGTVSV